MSAPSPSEPATGRASFDPGHFARLFEIETRSFWFRGRSDLIEWALARYFPLARDFLEIGCGTGYVLDRLHRAFPALTLHGTELYDEGLAYAHERLGDAAALTQADATNLQFRAEFDAVGAFDVIEHIEDDRRVLENVHAALRPGGGLLVTVPQHPWLWSDTDIAACHVRRYTRAELREKLAAAGFDVLRITSFVSLLLPAMLLARRRRDRKGMDEVEAELALPALLDAIGYATLRAESLAIRCGIDWPAGGSLLAVARKRGP
ncbi:MAG TPA: class I SAM-dependent methyltransferase [Rhodanobacteraceae bacterium]|nr:class I SAM-dependent methyltransferase [Rhodanobacteraceae bacterium]